MDSIYDNVPRFMTLADILEGTKPMDSSMTSTFKECPRKFFYRYVLGRDGKEVPPYFRFGGAYHKFREALELKIQETGELNEITASYAIGEAMKLWKEGGGNPPIGSWYEYMTDARLQLSCIEAIKKVRSERISRTFTVISVEMPFSVQMPDGFYTSGRIDQVVLQDGEPCIRDFKTASRFGDTYERKLNPNDQFSRYMYALTLLRGSLDSVVSSEPIRKLYVEVLHNNKTNGPKLHTLLASRSNDQFSAWLRDATSWNHQIKKAFEDDNFPMNEQSCTTCPYHKVCASPTARMQLARLDNDYEVRVWNPLAHDGTAGEE